MTKGTAARSSSSIRAMHRSPRRLRSTTAASTRPEDSAAIASSTLTNGPRTMPPAAAIVAARSRPTRASSSASRMRRPFRYTMPSTRTLTRRNMGTMPTRVAPSGDSVRYRTSEPRQHFGLELLHVGQDFRDRRAAEAGVDRADAQLLERLDVARDVGRRAGEELALAIVGLGGQAVAPAREAHGDADRLRIAAGFGGELAQPRDAGGQALQAVHREGRVVRDRIPGVAVLGGAPQRRARL